MSRRLELKNVGSDELMEIESVGSSDMEIHTASDSDDETRSSALVASVTVDSSVPHSAARHKDSDASVHSVESVESTEPSSRFGSFRHVSIDDDFSDRLFSLDSPYIYLIQVSTYSLLEGPIAALKWRNDFTAMDSSLQLASDSKSLLFGVDDSTGSSGLTEEHCTYIDLEKWIPRQTLDGQDWMRGYDTGIKPPAFSNKCMFVPEFGVVLHSTVFDSSLAALHDGVDRHTSLGRVPDLVDVPSHADVDDMFGSPKTIESVTVTESHLEAEDPTSVGRFSLVVAVPLLFYTRFMQVSAAIEHWCANLAAHCRYLFAQTRANRLAAGSGMLSFDETGDECDAYECAPFLDSLIRNSVPKFDVLFQCGLPQRISIQNTQFAEGSVEALSATSPQKPSETASYSVASTSSGLSSIRSSLRSAHSLPTLATTEEVSSDGIRTVVLPLRTSTKYNVDFELNLCQIISSHLQTAGRTVLVGDNADEINAFILTLALFSTEKQRQLSRLAVAVKNHSELIADYVPQLYTQGLVIDTKEVVAMFRAHVKEEQRVQRAQRSSSTTPKKPTFRFPKGSSMTPTASKSKSTAETERSRFTTSTTETDGPPLLFMHSLESPPGIASRRDRTEAIEKATHRPHSTTYGPKSGTELLQSMSGKTVSAETPYSTLERERKRRDHRREHRHGHGTSGSGHRSGHRRHHTSGSQSQSEKLARSRREKRKKLQTEAMEWYFTKSKAVLLLHNELYMAPGPSTLLLSSTKTLRIKHSTDSRHTSSKKKKQTSKERLSSSQSKSKRRAKEKGKGTKHYYDDSRKEQSPEATVLSDDVITRTKTKYTSTITSSTSPSMAIAKKQSSVRTVESATSPSTSAQSSDGSDEEKAAIQSASTSDMPMPISVSSATLELDASFSKPATSPLCSKTSLTGGNSSDFAAEETGIDTSVVSFAGIAPPLELKILSKSLEESEEIGGGDDFAVRPLPTSSLTSSHSHDTLDLSPKSPQMKQIHSAHGVAIKPLCTKRRSSTWLKLKRQRVVARVTARFEVKQTHLFHRFPREQQITLFKKLLACKSEVTAMTAAKRTRTLSMIAAADDVEDIEDDEIEAIATRSVTSTGSGGRLRLGDRPSYGRLQLGDRPSDGLEAVGEIEEVDVVENGNGSEPPALVPMEGVRLRSRSTDDASDLDLTDGGSGARFSLKLSLSLSASTKRSAMHRESVDDSSIFLTSESKLQKQSFRSRLRTPRWMRSSKRSPKTPEPLDAVWPKKRHVAATASMGVKKSSGPRKKLWSGGIPEDGELSLGVEGFHSGTATVGSSVTGVYQDFAALAERRLLTDISNSMESRFYSELKRSPIVIGIVRRCLRLPLPMRLPFIEVQHRVILMRANEVIIFLEHCESELLRFYDRTAHVMNCSREMTQNIPDEVCKREVRKALRDKLRSSLRIESVEDLRVILSTAHCFRPNLYFLIFSNPVFNIEHNIEQVLQFFFA